MPRPDASRIFGLVIRQAREASGVSQEALAAEAGLHRTYVSLLERGQRTPSLTVIVRLAAALGLRAADLIAAFEAERDRERTL